MEETVSHRQSVRCRARYSSSIIEAIITEPGDNYENQNETYVIFIPEHDVLKAGQPIFDIARMIQVTSASFGDGSHILYVNAQIKDNTALGQLMHDFACTKAEEMHYPILAKRVRYFKEEQEGVATMSRIFEEIKREAALEAARITAREKSIQVARRMLMMGKYSYEEISAISDLTLVEVKALDEGKPA